MLPQFDSGDRRAADLDLRYENRVADRARAKLEFGDARPRRILFIHGCNTSEGSGQKTTAPLRTALLRRNERLKDEIWTVTWPGNVSWTGGGLLAYGAMVERAGASGRLLAHHLQEEHLRQQGSPDLVLIAHSLGCRLAMEMVSELQVTGNRAGLSRIVLILMGAAVPVGKSALISLAKSSAHVTVLYSEADMALKRWFPWGQRLAGEGNDEAVGFKANPQPWASAIRMQGYNHQHYWSGEQTADVVAERLSDLFSDLKFLTDPGRENRLADTGALPATPALPAHSVAHRRL